MKLTLRKVRLNSGGYAPEFNYRYFGIGKPLYFYADAVNDDTEGDDTFLRADNRDDAKQQIRARYRTTVVEFLR